jgi:hypothetical protein
LPDAIVRALGQPGEARTGPDGAWRLNNLAPGEVSLVVRTPGYDGHGMLAGARRLTIRAGQVARVDFRAPNARAMIDELCADRRLSVSRATLRVLVVDSASGAPQPGLTLRASWNSPPFPGVPARAGEVRVRTDSRGAATFCYLPANAEVELAITPESGGAVSLFTAHTERNRLEARVAAVRAR